MKIHTFAPDARAGEILRDWWLALADNRGDRAELRRARSPDDAVLVPATVYLVTALRKTDVADHGGWIGRIPLIAGVVAHLDPNKEQTVLHDTTSLPERMAITAPNSDRPLVSELRFRRLLRTPRHGLYRPMIRILALLDYQANLYELAESLFWWGPKVQKDWAFTYFPRLKRKK